MTTLASLVAELHPVSLRLVAAPGGSEATVGEPVLFDPNDETGPEPGDLVLGVGVHPTSDDSLRLLRRLGAAGVGGLVLKAAGDPPPALVAAANESGMALLLAPVTVGWGQLYSLIRTATAVGSLAHSGAGVPIGNLFSLADAVAAAVGGATTIEDPGGRVLAYSNLDQPIDDARREAILGRQVSAAWMRKLNEAGVFPRLWQDPGVLRLGDFDVPGIRPRLAIAVRAGAELVGAIFVIEGEQPFGAGAEQALGEAAGLAALHILRHRSSEDLDRRRRAEALWALLDGRSPPEIGASTLDIGVNTPVTVVALMQAETDEAEAAVQAQRAADLIALYCESYRRRAACVAIAGTIYVLLPEPGPAHRDRIVALVESIVARAQETLHVDLRGGIGSTVGTLREVTVSRREAEQAVRALAGDPRARSVADIDAVRSRTILTELGELVERKPSLRAGRLGVLAEQDRERGTAYLPTLRAYLDAFGDVTLASSVVNVHPNTFRYRIRRLCDISGIDLDDPDERLVVQLQLRFLDRG
ncbi:MAG TPA: helix-turn-helix domain-containing protein [Mycobacteriales bacterium]|nr:helix-turn-helix domain-containing protein [Mycobacteriales bacterium]